MNPSIDLRRQPRQQRAMQRVDAILDATEAIFAEVGFAAASTNAIAARAETNIASLYQYFPNKETILACVVDRYQKQYHEVVSQNLTDDCYNMPFSALIDRLTESVISLHGSHRIAQPFFMGVGASNEFAAAEQQIYAEIIARTDTILSIRLPSQNAVQRQAVVQVLFRTMQNLVVLADTSRVEQRGQIISGLKTMLRAYLESLSGE